MRSVFVLVGVLLTTVLLTTVLVGAADMEKPSESAAPPAAAKSPVGFVKGYTWGWTGRRGQYEGPKPAESMKKLAETGAQWVTVAFAATMPTKSTPAINYGDTNKDLVTDAEIRRAISLARDNKLKVILKPAVNCDDRTWRARIEFKTPDGQDDPAAWAKWWKSYNSFMLHYAKIAAETKCEMLCIGCEMISTERFVDEWRGLVARIREVYQGPLVYNGNHGCEENIAWWDAVDIIGVSAYYPVGTKEDSSLAAMTASWAPLRDKLQKLSRKFNRPVMFIEIGIRSAAGCHLAPADYWTKGVPYDGQMQARYYEAALKAFWDEPWFCGYSWWDWQTTLYEPQEADSNLGFCIYGKPAATVLREWYAKTPAAQGARQ